MGCNNGSDFNRWLCAKLKESQKEQRICLNTAAPAFLPVDVNNPTIEEVKLWVNINLNYVQKNNGTQIVYYIGDYEPYQGGINMYFSNSNGVDDSSITFVALNGNPIFPRVGHEGEVIKIKENDIYVYDETLLKTLIEEWLEGNGCEGILESPDLDNQTISISHIKGGFLEVDYGYSEDGDSYFDHYESQAVPMIPGSGGTCDEPDFIWTLNEDEITLSHKTTIGGVTYIEVTYTELDNLIDGSLLESGQNYLITDYQTVHIIPNTEDINTAPIEPLIVTAISESEIAPIAYSQLYPQDIIYYHVGTDETNFPGATKGYISRRIDTIQNNDIGTDWRHCKYRRYKINQPNWDGATAYHRGSAVKRTTGSVAQQKEIYISLKEDNLNHAVTDTTWWRRFEWNNESYAAVSSPWIIVDDAFTMQIEADGNDYQDRLLFTYNMNIRNNEIKTYSLMNTTVGTNFSNNSVGNYFGNNSVGNNFMFNEVFVEVADIDFLLATHVYSSYNKRIFKRSDGNIRLSYTNASDILVVVDAIS